MREIGIDTVIMIRAGHKRWLTYPSAFLINKHKCYRPSEDLLQMFLELSDMNGMDFYFGLYDAGLFFEDPQHYKSELEINLRVIDEVWQMYGQQHSSFKGWYISHELSRKTKGAIELISGLAEHCKTVSGSLPTMISPYIDGTKALLSSQSQLQKDQAVSLKMHEKEWDEIFAGIQSSIDIVAFQDGHVPLHELGAYLQVNKSLADKYNIRSWSNIESFDRDMPIKFLPIKWEKMKMKLEAATAAKVEKAITFEFSHFMSPQSCYLQARHLNARYRGWLGV